jgi:hypothetical protein
MSTALTTFHTTLRVILSDRDLDVHLYEAQQLTDAMTAVISLGKVVGDGVNAPDGYSVSAGAISPSLTAVADPIAFAQLIWHTGRMFVAGLTSTHFRTRAFSESIGDPGELVNYIITELYSIESGEMMG